MDAGAPASSTVSAASTRMTSRKHPMHTCVVSLIALGRIVFAKSLGFDGRIGSVMKRVAAVAKPITPFLRAIQYIWLTFLSFFDGYILAVENLIEIIFPSSAHVFDKIDEFIRVVEVLPRKLDDMIVHQTPVLDFALVLAISWLNFFVSLLTSERTKEKEIKIDVNYEGIHAESRSVEEAHEFAESLRNENLEKFPPLSYTPEAGSETDESTAKADATNFSYGKEVLEKGKQEKVENEGGDEAEEENVKTEENDAVEKVSEGKEENKIDATEEENDAVDEVSKIDAPKDENDAVDEVSKGEEGNKIDAAEDAILKLFEDSWHMTPPKRR